MKKLILLTSFLLCACTPSAKEVVYPIMPEGLKDCKSYEVSDGLSHVHVFRCPNSTTSTSYFQNKQNNTVIVIDGVNYTPEEK